MQGADLSAVQKIMRHRDPRITSETYLHLDPDYLQKQIDRLSFGSPGLAAPLVSTVCLASGEAAAGRDRAPSEPKPIQAPTTERDIGFEPTTFSLGS